MDFPSIGILGGWCLNSVRFLPIADTAQVIPIGCLVLWGKSPEAMLKIYTTDNDVSLLVVAVAVVTVVEDDGDDSLSTRRDRGFYMSFPARLRQSL